MQSIPVGTAEPQPSTSERSESAFRFIYCTKSITYVSGKRRARLYEIYPTSDLSLNETKPETPVAIENLIVAHARLQELILPRSTLWALEVVPEKLELSPLSDEHLVPGYGHRA